MRDFPDLDGITGVSVGDGHLCFTAGAEAAAFCAGNGGRGELGIGRRPTTIQADPVAVMLDDTTTLTGVDEIVISGAGFSCARTSDNVYCWGRNQRGQLGDVDDMGVAVAHDTCVVDMTEMWDCSDTPVVVGGASPLGATTDLDLGSQHVCAVQGTGGPGQVVCWGENRGRQAGQADADSVPAPSPVSGLDDAVMIATGSNHSCALRGDGTVACWGLNRDGQLGDGLASHGTNCMLDSENVDCSATPVEVATIDDATFIAARASFTCVTRGGDGSVWCWGNNNNKQLGDGTRDNRFEPVMVMGTAAP